MNESAILQDAPDFSLVLGGALFQLFRRAHLSGDTMELRGLLWENYNGTEISVSRSIWERYVNEQKAGSQKRPSQ